MFLMQQSIFEIQLYSLRKLYQGESYNFCLSCENAPPIIFHGRLREI